MNWEQLEGQWAQVKGSVRAKWGKLTDDDVETLGGKKDQFVGKIQERYGILKDDAEKQLDSWLASFKSTMTKPEEETSSAAKK